MLYGLEHFILLPELWLKNQDIVDNADHWFITTSFI